MCRNEQTCLSGMAKSVKRFERSNGLDTALYKNYLFSRFHHHFPRLPSTFPCSLSGHTRYHFICPKYSGTSPYGHLTSKKTSPLQSPWLSPKLYSTVQITPCNKVISPLRSLLPSPVGDLNSEVPLYPYIFLSYPSN